ncbi:MAG: flagellar assembly protein FliH [Usitatibacteraceae bacterium]
MSSRFIPRDQLSTALPWQLGAFDSQHAKRKTGLVDEVADIELAASAVNQARDEGFRHGLDVGFAQGHAAGEAKAQRHNQQLAVLGTGLENAIAALDETVADALIELALELARQVVRTHLDVNRDAIVPVMREALNGVVAIAKHPRLVMHPDDAEIMKLEMADELAAHNCRISPDEQMTRGGVRIDDANFELDATVQTRWSRTLATLGLKDDWLV